MKIMSAATSLWSFLSVTVNMSEWCLAWLCALLVTHSGFACGDIVFIERHEGESAVLPCVVDPRDPPPVGVYLMRRWLRPGEVLFKYTGEEFHADDQADKGRTSVSGDPSLHSLNVTVSQLRVTDTDRYHCDFIVSRPSAEDERVRGLTEYFLHVSADVSGSVDLELVETCVGGSAVLPCVPPHGEGLAVEGVSLKRQKGRSPVEVLYHSKRTSHAGFSAGRVHLTSAPGPGGLDYNLTLQQLQPEDSALYSCQLLLPGRPDAGTALGRRVFFVSVQGGQCGCPSYSSLLYALSSAVAVLFLLLLFVGCALVWKGKARRSVKTHPQAPIYEEMVGVQQQQQQQQHGRKPASRHLEEMESTEYRNCPVKKSCPENHYESPSGGLK